MIEALGFEIYFVKPTGYQPGVKRPEKGLYWPKAGCRVQTLLNHTSTGVVDDVATPTQRCSNVVTTLLKNSRV